MSHATQSTLFALCLPLVACGASPGGGAADDTTGGSSTGATSGPTSGVSMTTLATTGRPGVTTSGAVDSTSTTAATSATTDSTGPGITFDLGVPPDSPVRTTCDKIDFLFVVDNSGSMQTVQSTLVGSFPGFVAGLQTVLDQGIELNVGVVTSDAYTYNVAGCNALGDLVVQTGGALSSNMPCGPYAAGANYMTQADDLATTFACAAQVGTSGSGIERPMEAMVNAVSQINAGPGECNEGFLRDDALLVVVVITDEWDGPMDPELDGSAGTPMQWYDAVVAAKLGIPEHAVALALISHTGSMTCPPLSEFYDAFHIADFIDLFGANGLVGGVCEPDYGPFFASAVPVITDACDAFVDPT